MAAEPRTSLGDLRGRDLLSAADISPDAWRRLLELASALKLEWQAAGRHDQEPLHGRAVALVFEHPSLRTRVSTELAVGQLGGQPVYLVGGDVGIGRREAAGDIGRTLGAWVSAIVARTLRDETCRELAAGASVPVVNGLTDREHPLQAVADALTVTEALGGVERRIIAFIGDGNNVAASLAIAVTSLGGVMRLATPAAYAAPADLMAVADDRARSTGGRLELLRDPIAAARGADVLYTDVWTSMGMEAQRDRRRTDLAGYTISRALLAQAAPDARVMHCLPAHPGEEIEAELLDAPASLIARQAENRLHATKAVLATLLSYPDA
ncbi:MAG: ornithine carbamoyltransferase [Candidatus Limnocylindrales bacterium]